MKPPPPQSPIVNRKSAIPASDAARAMSDAMLATLLSGFTLDASHLNRVRSTFTSYCRAHPHFKDIRTAWAAFHKELMAHLDGTANITAALAINFAPAEQAQPIAITTGDPPAAPWPEFLHRFWMPRTPTAFTDERLKLAQTNRRAVINLIATARRMGVPEEFILDRSKYTATDLAIRDIREATLKTSAPAERLMVESG